MPLSPLRAISTVENNSKIQKYIRFFSLFLLVVISAYALDKLIDTFKEIVIPLSLSIIISALLTPVVNILHHFKIPKILAVLISLLLLTCLFSLVIMVISLQISSDWDNVKTLLLSRIRELQSWLNTGPLHIRSININAQFNKIVDFANNNSSSIVHFAQNSISESLSFIAKFFEGLLLVLFCSIFLLYDGPNIWHYVTKMVPAEKRETIYEAGRVGFGSLVAYVRATFIVAASDAIIVYIGLSLVGVPLGAPLALVVFLGAFIPLVGALIAGILAVVIALITKGILAALITALIIILVIQIEAHVLQPFLLGRAVSLHPLAVVLAITAGGTLFDIWGAFIAVPTVAVGHSAINYLLHTLPRPVEENIDKELSDE